MQLVCCCQAFRLSSFSELSTLWLSKWPLRPDCDAKVRQDSQTTKTSYKKNRRKISNNAILLYRPSKNPPIEPIFRIIPLKRGFALFYPLWWHLRVSHAIIAPCDLYNAPLSTVVLHQFSASLGAFSKNVGDFPKNVGDFPKNVGHFPKNVGVFFQPPPREYFSQQIETQKKQEIKDQQAWKFNL